VARRGEIAVGDDRLNARFALALSTPARGSQARTTGIRPRRYRSADLALERHGVPCVILTLEQLRELPLGSRDAYVLSLVDGSLTVETILDVAAMPEDEASEILARLLDLGAIGLHPPRSDF